MAKRMSRYDRTVTSLAGLVVLAVLFVALNALSNKVLRGASLDFTENELFTLSDGTKQVLSEIDEPITLRYYYSDALGKAIPSYGSYATRVRELLERYADLADGGIRLEIHDPEPFSPEEDRAVGFGLQGIPLSGSGDLVYFGLVGTNSTDDEETVRFFRPERERFLEYDLTSLIASLASPRKRVVGLLSSLPLAGRYQGPGRAPSQAWMVLDQIRQTFEVQNLQDGVARTGEEVDVLMVVHPKGLSEQTLYAIDQYVLGGGKMVAFLDPNSEAETRLRLMSGQPVEPVSEMSKLFDAWGVEVPPDKVVGDLDAALRVNFNQAGRLEAADYILWLSLGGQNLNPNDAVTADLSEIRMLSPGLIRPKPEASTEIVPLIESNPRAMQVNAEKIRFMPDVRGLLASFEPENTEFVLAARLQGEVESAFPDGPPKAEETGEAAGENEKEGRSETPPGPHLAKSKGSINVVLIADTDILDDSSWVRQQDFFGERFLIPISDNANFVLNLLDNLSGNPALIALRGRAGGKRPFELIRRLEHEAAMRYREKEQQLREKLENAEKRLAQLQMQDQGASTAILTPEQRAAIEEFRAEMLGTRKELREVQHALRKDIDRLEARLKLLNIGGLPILIGVAAVAVGVIRRRRQKKGRFYV